MNTNVPQGGRLPPWSRDELILALDLYLRFRPALPRKQGPEIAALAGLLRAVGAARLAGELPAALRAKFRNPAGVYMKLGNFLRLDSAYTGKGHTGLSRGSHDEEPVWAEFAGDPARCHAVADAIRQAISTGAVLPADDDEDDRQTQAPEGAILTRLHRVRERDRKLARRKRALHLKTHGKYFCEACGLEPARAYGTQSHAPLQCHHVRPLHTLTTPTAPTMEDVVLLCANCHTIVHAERPWLTMSVLRARVRLQYGYEEGSAPSA